MDDLGAHPYFWVDTHMVPQLNKSSQDPPGVASNKAPGADRSSALAPSRSPCIVIPQAPGSWIAKT